MDSKTLADLGRDTIIGSPRCLECRHGQDQIHRCWQYLRESRMEEWANEVGSKLCDQVPRNADQVIREMLLHKQAINKMNDILQDMAKAMINTADAVKDLRQQLVVLKENQKGKKGGKHE
jgi:hypothetical protein